MINIKENLYTLALKMCPKIGNITTRKLINHFSSAEKVWFASKKELNDIFGVYSVFSSFIGEDIYLKQAENELKIAEENGIKVLHFKDKYYPKFLSETYDAPVILFLKGNYLNENNKNISIVGTRNITNYGKKFIPDFLEEIESFPINIISGFAFGVDITAQKKCVELNIPTFGVLAHGLNDIYPKAHKEIALEVLNNSGGFFSEYLFYSKPDREKFLQRNRIIAGISECTLIIESAFGGGAMTTANYANQYNREVFALPGRISDVFSQGCNQLIKKHQAQILNSSKDILELLNLTKKTKKDKIIQKPLFLDLSENEQLIYTAISEKGKIQIDELSEFLEIPTFGLMSSLLNLELKGIINPLAGKYFEIKE